MKATKPQITKIQVLISQLGLRGQKENIVSQYSATGKTSTKELTVTEASSLLKWLSSYDPLDGMRRKIFALAYEAGIIYGDSPEDKKLNSVKLDQFLMKTGTVKKAINKMSKDELNKTVNQFTQIVKHNQYNQAGKATRDLLKEMNIATSIK